MRRFLAVLLCIFASEVYGDEQPRVFESPRALGRGGTIVASYDSYEGARHNPAVLGDFAKTFQLRIIELDALAGQNTLNLISDFSDMFSSDDPLASLRKFDDKFGERQYFRGQISALSMRIGRFEISPFGVNSSFLDLRNRQVPEVEWSADTYGGIQMSYGRPLGKTWLVGMTVRPMIRKVFAGELTLTDLAEFISPDDSKFKDQAEMQSGKGIGVDLGMLWTPSKTFRFGMTAQNVGDTSFKADGDGPAPAAMKQVLSMGVLKRVEWGKLHNDMTFDIQSLMNREAINILRLIHLGNEFGYSAFTPDNDFGLLLGLNEGYFGGGAFADLWIGRIDITNYAVELGVTPGQRMDRRWAFSWRTAMTF
ncbi:MAG: conjugal transfer protein TraF [Oligoflexales bacterium]